jgi:septum formation protein
MKRPPLILASTSPYRRDLLARLRIPFEQVDPGFDEIAAPAGRITPESVRALVLENARGKALSLGGRHPDALILASDQLGECDGRLLSKPGTAEKALAQLRFLSGKEHRLHGAVALLDPREGRCDAEVETTHLRMRPLPEEALRRYVELDHPVTSAGSYFSERLGIVLFEWLRADDPTAVIGLPLLLTVRLLERAGISPLTLPPEELWAPPSP